MKAIITLLRDDHEKSEVTSFEVPCNDVYYDEETNSIIIAPSSLTSKLNLVDKCNLHNVKVQPAMSNMKDSKVFILHSETHHMQMQITKGKFYFPIKNYCNVFKVFDQIWNPLKYV